MGVSPVQNRIAQQRKSYRSNKCFLRGFEYRLFPKVSIVNTVGTIIIVTREKIMNTKVFKTSNRHFLLTVTQCCGSKYIEFGSGSKVMLSILKVKIQNNFREKQCSLKQVYFLKL